MKNLEAQLHAKHKIQMPINKWRPIAQLISEGFLVKDPENGDWVLDELYLGNYLDAQQIEFLEQTGRPSCRSIYRFTSDVDTSAIAATSYYQIEDWFLDQYKYKNIVLSFSVGNYYFNKLTYIGANGTRHVGTTVEKLNSEAIVFSNVHGEVRGKMPKTVTAALEQLEQQGIAYGSFKF
jgi:hypothetical protein